MIEFIFTIDYEIYGNGEGSLKDHIYKPTRQLQQIFDLSGEKMVFFIEAAELEKIEAANSDLAISNVKKQIRDLYVAGHEIALHLHPQWYNGDYENGRWKLDYSEYNLCKLSEKRIAELADRSIGYLRSVLSDPSYTPLSFRAGNWLFQPTQPLTNILYNQGIRVDSSVFKGGLQHQHNLDYRLALRNGYFWSFQDDVNTPVSVGKMMEIPIYSEMVLPWKMATKKRLGLQQIAASGRKTLKQQVYRLLDLARLQQPLKLDFCRMTIEELTGMMDNILHQDGLTPNDYKPVVAIGHTKDLIDFDTLNYFISHLKKSGVKITTFKEAYNEHIQQ
jgi:hypothetical protein